MTRFSISSRSFQASGRRSLTVLVIGESTA